MSLRNEMRRAFTLVELLVVIALMGMMSTLAIGSYSAITRGMSERAALDVAKALVDAAVQRSNLDRTKIHVYLFDEVLKTDSDTARGVGAGVAIAVRPVGRISMIPSEGFYCDEFTDLSQIYGALASEEVSEEEAAEDAADDEVSAMRLYNMSNSGSSGYTTVQEGVVPYEINDYDLEDTTDADGNPPEMRQWRVYGFKRTKKGNNANFKVGDQYGQEFAVMRLPVGYFFGSSVSMSGTSDLGQHFVDCIEIDPTDRKTPSVNIYVRRPNGSFESIGNVNQVKDGE